MPTLERALKVLSPLTLALSPLWGAGHILVLETAPGAWQFIGVTDVQVNDRGRVHLDPTESAPSRKPVHEADYKGMRSLRLSDAPPIVTHPKGGALTPWGAPDKFAVVIPEGHRLETPMTSDYLWSSTWISYAQEGQPRKRQALSTGKVFAIVPSGADPANALAEFALKPEFFFDRGTESDGFRKRMSLVEAVAAAYPKDPASQRLSEYVFQEMSLRFFRAERDQSAYGDLLDSLAFASVSERIRPEDDRHRKMRATVTGFKQRIDREKARVKALAAMGAILAGGDGTPAGLEIRGGDHLKEAAALLVADNLDGAARVLISVASAPAAGEAPAAWRILHELQTVSPEVKTYLASASDPSVTARIMIAGGGGGEARVEEPPPATPSPVVEGVAPPVQAPEEPVIPATASSVPAPVQPPVQPPVTVTPLPAKPPLPGKVLAIQVAASRDGKGAQALARTLTAKGFDARVRQAGPLYRIMVGPFQTDKAAQDVRVRLSRGGYQGYIRTYPGD